jgi:hypothetical protein
MTHRLHCQPDDPGVAICQHCGSTYRRDPDDDARRLLERNAGRVPESIIARAAGISLRRLRRIARQSDPPFDLTVKHEREHDPVGA